MAWIDADYDAETARELLGKGANPNYLVPFDLRKGDNEWCGTAFQESVWLALTAIPSGDTVTYAEIARAIGRPRSARPVGGAIGKNPLPIIVPCHRVIGTDQTLTGFTGGLDIKIRLLQLEGWEVL